MTGEAARRLAAHGLSAQRAALQAGEVSSRELVTATLARIAEHDGALNAFRAVLAESALADAAAADRARSEGDDRPLLGVPVAVKDDTDVAGVPTLLGSGSPEPPAAADAPLVELLRSAGAVVVGKTHLPELALWGVTASRWHGITRNPHDLSRTPGGSSGGSAAAVAAGLVPLATGSDGLGSLRIPAAACGLVSIKHTRGLIPQRSPGWHGMSEVGLLARDPADLALALEAVAGLRPEPAPDALRVGWSLRAPVPVRVAPEVRRAALQVGSALAGLGHDVRPVDIPYGVLSGAAGLVRSWLCGAADDRARLADRSAVEPRTARLTALGARCRPLLPWALREGDRLRDRLDRLLEQVDVLLLPATATPSPAASALEGRGLVRTALVNATWGPFTGTFNASGHPALAISLACPGGAPVGVQLVGRHGADGQLLALAGALAERVPSPPSAVLSP